MILSRQAGEYASEGHRPSQARAARNGKQSCSQTPGWAGWPAPPQRPCRTQLRKFLQQDGRDRRSYEVFVRIERCRDPRNRRGTCKRVAWRSGNEVVDSRHVLVLVHGNHLGRSTDSAGRLGHDVRVVNAGRGERVARACGRLLEGVCCECRRSVGEVRLGKVCTCFASLYCTVSANERRSVWNKRVVTTVIRGG